MGTCSIQYSQGYSSKGCDGFGASWESYNSHDLICTSQTPL